MSVPEYKVIPGITGKLTQTYSVSDFFTFPLFFSIVAILSWILILTANELKKYTEQHYETLLHSCQNIQKFATTICATTLRLCNSCLCGTDFCPKDISTCSAPNFNVYSYIILKLV